MRELELINLWEKMWQEERGEGRKEMAVEGKGRKEGGSNRQKGGGGACSITPRGREEEGRRS